MVNVMGPPNTCDNHHVIYAHLWTSWLVFELEKCCCTIRIRVQASVGNNLFIYWYWSCYDKRIIQNLFLNILISIVIKFRLWVYLWVRHDVLILCGYSCHAVMVDDASKLTQQHHGEQWTIRIETRISRIPCNYKYR